MSIHLSDDDLRAIGLNVRPIIADEISKAIEDSDLRTAAGFAEIHAKFDDMRDDLDSVKQTVEKIERVKRTEIERVYHQESAINKMPKALKAV